MPNLKDTIVLSVTTSERKAIVGLNPCECCRFEAILFRPERPNGVPFTTDNFDEACAIVSTYTTMPEPLVRRMVMTLLAPLN